MFNKSSTNNTHRVIIRSTGDEPIDLGFDLGDKTKIETDVVPNIRRAPNTAWLREL